MKSKANLLLLCALAPAAALAQQQADVAAGKAKAEAVCAACHGANGISIADNIPNLAGQRVAYLEGELRALKAGTRRAPSMNAMAAQLSPADIANVAAYFGSLTPTNTMAKSDQLPALARTNIKFPDGYKNTFKMYTTVNRPDINQVRYLYANPVALTAAREGKPLPDGSVLVLEQHAAKLDGDRKPVVGPDGFFVADRLVAYALMERQAGWGKDIPEMLRNDEWHYAVYNPDFKIRAGVNHADCMACHKPLDQKSYTFSIEPLTMAAKR